MYLKSKFGAYKILIISLFFIGIFGSGVGKSFAATVDTKCSPVFLESGPPPNYTPVSVQIVCGKASQCPEAAWGVGASCKRDNSYAAQGNWGWCEKNNACPSACGGGDVTKEWKCYGERPAIEPPALDCGDERDASCVLNGTCACGTAGCGSGFKCIPNNGYPKCVEFACSCTNDTQCASGWACDNTFKLCKAIPTVLTDSIYPDKTIWEGKMLHIDTLIAPVAKFLYYAGLTLGILFIIYSGYLFMSSSGDPRSMEEAKETLTAAILGIFFIILASAILKIVLTQILGASL